MARKEFSQATRKRAMKRSKGRCEAVGIKYGLPQDQRCNAPIDDKSVEYDHFAEEYLTHDNSIENAKAVCHICHKYKTRRGSKERAKMKRLEKDRLNQNNERKSQRDKPKPKYNWPKGRKLKSRGFNKRKS